jgi:hypothetical protein
MQITKFFKLSLFIILLITIIPQSINAGILKPSPFLKSALVPGWGQLSIDKNYGYGMLTSEVLLWSTYFYNVNEQDLKHEASYEYALKFANVNPGKYSAQYYRDLTRYNSSGFEAGGYNAMVRQYAISAFSDPASQQAYIDANAIPDEMSWQWESTDRRKKYSTMRKEILEMKDTAQVLTGVIIANHIISGIDMLRQKKHWKNVNTSVGYLHNTPILNLEVKF